MKKTSYIGLATLLPLLAYTWISAATSSDKAPTAATSASEYVYLHQTRNGVSTLQKVSDRSGLQCIAD